MYYVTAAIVGLIWGALIAFINCLITKSCLKKQSSSFVAVMGVVRFALDLLALAAVFFLRKLLPFSYETCLIATAVAISLGTLLSTFYLRKIVK
ncbi:MAG: hypothetical protein ACOX68_00175 [Candidatus Limivicinus sp.]|jgi:hypothetical protein